MRRPFPFLGVSGEFGVPPPPPVHIPSNLVAVLYRTIPIFLMSYGFWDQYADYLQSQSLSSYKGVVEEYDFVIGKRMI